MAVSQSDLDALTSAIANGEKSVRMSDGRWVEYHSPGDLIKARDYLIGIKTREDAAAAGTSRVRAVKLYHGGRGY
ncbi:conserved hypothetical protein [Aromatoleum aromaticum EbN1]|uniref:Uncharacterized protein n=1 Tax=Aromatoleum aromaticum (strain DSM 19018 / LMG 30748 / EbN1) TaxID=76114 RepID=Q5NXH0_AROAE|nr:hypothetical protein [Aromatoleum aromaticum]CAI10244.1 conserved hypothetical protein [Aromatoleum aromaticum EbN1]